MEAVLLSPSLMICLAAMAEERWMGSMKMLAASEPEIMENLDSEAMEKLRERSSGSHETSSTRCRPPGGPPSYLGDGQRR